MLLADIFASVAGIIVFISFIPQLIKSWKTKKVDDLSLAMFYLTLLSNTLYLAYAAMLSLIPVIVTMVFICLVVIAQVALIHKYR